MKFEFSAGGVVVKRSPSTLRPRSGRASSGLTHVAILVCQHSQHHGWVFPKGLIGPSASSLQSGGQAGQDQKETKEDAALREVKEETGVEAKIVKQITPVTYWYQWEGEKRKKTVYYFLMDFIGGDITKHDLEMENVEWLPVDEVAKRLTYPSDKKVWEVALRAINRRLKVSTSADHPKDDK